MTLTPKTDEQQARRDVSRNLRTLNQALDIANVAAIDAAEASLTASLKRLDAVLSQQPARHSGAWAA